MLGKQRLRRIRRWHDSEKNNSDRCISPTGHANTVPNFYANAHSYIHQNTDVHNHANSYIYSYAYIYSNLYFLTDSYVDPHTDTNRD